ncbi:MAG: HemK/PrmC family methyltransferase [Acidimicrobiales bacterium]
MEHEPAPRWLVERLAAAGCIAPEAEAAELVATTSDEVDLAALVARREQGEPLAWLTGRVRFGGLTLAIDTGVYVPRPQTEQLARRAAALLPDGGRAVDLCTGVGAIAALLQAAVPTARVVGVDLDPAAVACAHRNGVAAVVGDLGGPLRPDLAADVVTAVAPYVPTDALDLLPSDVRDHEPVRALDGGDDGLAVVRRIVTEAAGLLRPEGHLLVELGGDQPEALAADLAAAGFALPDVWHDDEGDPRGLTATLTGGP